MKTASSQVPFPNHRLTQAAGTLPTKLLVGCGILSALLYVAMNIVVPLHYPGYNAASQTVSELSAIGAPSRALWVAMGIGYTILLIAFGIGVWLMGTHHRAFKALGAAFILQGIIGPFWPPMHQREVLAAGGGTISDTLHIAFTFVWLVLVLLSLTSGAIAFGKPFRLYTLLTGLLLLASGIPAGIDAPRIQANLPTPFTGVWERVSIGLFLAWQVVLAAQLLRKGEGPAN